MLFSILLYLANPLIISNFVILHVLYSVVHCLICIYCLSVTLVSVTVYIVLSSQLAARFITNDLLTYLLTYWYFIYYWLHCGCCYRSRLMSDTCRLMRSGCTTQTAVLGICSFVITVLVCIMFKQVSMLMKFIDSCDVGKMPNLRRMEGGGYGDENWKAYWK